MKALPLLLVVLLVASATVGLLAAAGCGKKKGGDKKDNRPPASRLSGRASRISSGTSDASPKPRCTSIAATGRLITAQ